MTYTPKKIKRALKKCINEISLLPKQFANNPEKDFIPKKTKTKILFLPVAVKIHPKFAPNKFCFFGG